MIARVLSVDMGKRTASVIVSGAGGTRKLTDVKLTHKCSPGVNDNILVMSDGGEYYGIDKVSMETPEAVETEEESQLVPGDEIMGDPETGTGLSVRKGGLISLMASKTVGFVLSKINGFLQLFGQNINIDTTFFHGRIKTLMDERNTSVNLSLFGSPLGNPLSTEIIKAAIDTMQAKADLDVGGMASININLNIAPQTGIVTGPNLNINLATPQGMVQFRVNGATGIVEAISPTIMKLSAQMIMINSEGSPLDRVLTAKDLCTYTGNMHGQGSGKVFVGI